MKKLFLLFVPVLLLSGCQSAEETSSSTSKSELTSTTSTTSVTSTSSQELVTESSENQAETDLNIEEINNNNLASLVGTWENAKGDTLIIYSDGSTNKNLTVHGVENSDQTSTIPYASLTDGTTGAALGLFKIGFENPDGDRSDTSRPRVIIAQQSGNYSPETYYYRQ